VASSAASRLAHRQRDEQEQLQEGNPAT